jgi:hypothetical protein
MPRIELVLPGTPIAQPSNIAEIYRITVERLDGKACGEIEARTVMTMFQIQPFKPKRKRKAIEG